MEILTLGVFCILLVICIITGRSILYALLAGFVIFSLYSRKQGFTCKQIGKMAWQGIWKVKNILITFVLIGMLTALWRQAGTIPTIICYTVHLIKPSTFLLMTFLLNCLISVLTGTALGIGTIDTAITDKYALAKISTVTVEAGTVAANGFSGNIATTFTKVSDDAKCIPVLINGGWLTCTKSTINGNTLNTEFANWSNGSHSSGGTFYILQFVKMK